MYMGQSSSYDYRMYMGQSSALEYRLNTAVMQALKKQEKNTSPCPAVPKAWPGLAATAAIPLL
jgi:hypothetical protein